MRAKFYLLLFLGLNFLVSCNSIEQDCHEKRFMFNNETFYVKGCMVDNLENGEWVFYDSANRVTEKGGYEKGIRIGNWYYPDNKSNPLIVWKKHQGGSLSFNIPADLEIAEESTDFIKYSNNDTSKLLNIGLSVHSLEQVKKGFEDYYKQGEEEILSRGWTFGSKKTTITTMSKSFYFNEYTVNINNFIRFKILNAYRMIDKEKIFEITCRFDEKAESTARIYFFSIITNSFYNQERFMDAREKIKSFVEK